jgi:hypothetical protein
MSRKQPALSGRFAVSAAILLAALTAIAAGQEWMAGLASAAPSSRRAPQAWGTASETMLQISAALCGPVAGTTAASGDNGYFYATGASGIFDCPMDLPAGAIPTRLELVANDADDAGDLEAFFVRCPSMDISLGCIGTFPMTTSGTAAAPFTGYLSVDLTPYNLVVDKAANLYFVRIATGVPGVTNQFRQVNVFCRRQVSAPPPGTQTFGDVPPTHTFYKAIEALSASGITGGCGGGNFCPGGNVTRGEVAAFLARALGLHFPN